MIARKIRRVESRGEAWLYECSPAVWPHYGGEESATPEERAAQGHRFVIVSAVDAPRLGLLETYLFPSNEEGQWVDMIELPQSQKGFADPDRALREAGYEIVSA